MMVLLMKLFGLFALKSKKPLFITLGIALLIALAAPTVINPILKSLSVRSRLSLIAKINAVERAKLKEPILRKNYDSLLEDYAGRGIKVSIAKSKKAKTLADCFSGNGPKTLWAGSAVWILIGTIGLFSFNSKVIHRILVFLVFCLIGLVCGIAATLVPEITPFYLHVALVVCVEVVALSVVGTLANEINRNA